jgi:putative peptidoglycan lipid II flippase
MHDRPSGATAKWDTRQQVLIRGGLTITAGIITGNVSGFVRVALTAYLLGTHSRADALAVAIGPIDTLNSVLINSMVFAFVPMLTEYEGRERTALFLKLNRLFGRVFTAVALALVIFAPWLMRALAPGLEPAYYAKATNILRILSLSTMAAGAAAIHSALLYTDRRFAPSAFYQACLNVCTVLGALIFWPFIGIYGFAIGYAVGAWVQFAVVYFFSRNHLDRRDLKPSKTHWRELLSKPSLIIVYSGVLALNITFTRAWATQSGPGMAAALDYCMRGVSVPMAFLVSPLSNSLLPEIARLRSQMRLKEAYRLIDQTLGLGAVAAFCGCAVAILFRTPAIALLFQRGSFTAQSTLLVSAVFLGMAPSMVGWSLLELNARSLFALDRGIAPLAASFVPVLINVAISLGVHSAQPQWLGLGASTGFFIGFLLLFAMFHRNRKAA